MATAATLGLGLLAKAPCAAGSWGDGRQFRWLCYSDIVPLYGTEQLSGDRLPYVDRCERIEGGQCDEYPVLTMYAMRAAAWVVRGYGAFFYANAALLSAFALVTSVLLHRLVGARALYFALAPTLAIFAFVNWDLLAVGLATAGTFAFLRDRNGASGLLLGLGAATKLYPGLLVVPFALDRLRGGRPREAGKLTMWAVGAYVAVNAPFAAAAPEAWATFFWFNAERPPDWGSLWFVACGRLHGDPSGACPWSTDLVNWLTLAAFLAVAVLLWWAVRIRRPQFPAWTFGFPLIVAFLLTNKVYSPQYSLWLLPWFALTLPSPLLFAAFEATDVAVFVTTFTFFGRLEAAGNNPAFAGFTGAPLWALQVALVVRAAVLLACLAAWVRRPERNPELFGAVRFPQLEAPA